MFFDVTYILEFYYLLRNKWWFVKVMQKRFHSNGHTIGFPPDSKVGTTIYVSIIDSGSEMVK